MKKSFFSQLILLLVFFSTSQASAVTLKNSSAEPLFVRLMDNQSDKEKFEVSGHSYVKDRTFNGKLMEFNTIYTIAPNASATFSFESNTLWEGHYIFQRLVLSRKNNRDLDEAHINIHKAGDPFMKDNLIDYKATRESEKTNVLMLNGGQKKAILTDYNGANQCLRDEHVLLVNSSGKQVSWRLMTRADKSKYGVGGHDNITKRLAWYHTTANDTFAPAFSQNKYDTLSATGPKSKVCLDIKGKYQRVIVGFDQGSTKGAYFTISRRKIDETLYNTHLYKLALINEDNQQKQYIEVIS